jgi:hypothetical protein
MVPQFPVTFPSIEEFHNDPFSDFRGYGRTDQIYRRSSRTQMRLKYANVAWPLAT